MDARRDRVSMLEIVTGNAPERWGLPYIRGGGDFQGLDTALSHFRSGMNSIAAASAFSSGPGRSADRRTI